MTIEANYLTTKVADARVDALRNIARRAAIRVIQVEKTAVACNFSTASLEALVIVENRALAAFNAYGAALTALIA